MKRTFCAILALYMLLFLSGCAKRQKPPQTVDLEYYVRLGKISGCEYVLGVSADEIEDFDEITAQNGRVCIKKNGVYYYYDENDAAKAIKYIVSFNGAYGFSTGTSTDTVMKELARGEMKAPQLPLEEEETFYAQPGNYTGIKYTYGVNTTCLVFLEDRLYACTMY